MDRRTSLLAVGLLLAALAPSIVAAAERRPNVLVMLTDDQRWDALGLGGARQLRTPHMDRLGAEGVYFRNAFCTTSLCSPSRASILSGLYAHAHGVVNNFTEYPANLRSFPGVLQAQGYDTAYIGKWHMGEENDEPRPGFNWFVTHKGQGRYFDSEFNFNGKRREVVKGYYTTVVTDLAEEWLGRERAGKPWCLIVGHKAPHSFYTPEPKYARAFDDVRVPYPESAFLLDDKPAWIQARRDTWHGIFGPLFDWRKKFPDDSPEGVRDFEAMTRAYWATLLSVDDSVGRLVELLRERNELDDTIVVLMSDNGLLSGEHGMVDKRTAHEPSIRIVQVVRFPGLTPSERPRVIDEQVLSVDLAPSLLELCGAPPLEPVHGKSWVKLVRQEDSAWRASWLYYYNYERQFPYTPNVRGVRTESWKYIRYPHGDGGPDRHEPELYNIEFDPEERRNLAQVPKYAAVLDEMRGELTRAMAAVGLSAENDTMPVDEGIQQRLPEQAIR